MKDRELVFVYKDMIGNKIKVFYLDEAKEFEKRSKDWEHIATLNSRAWIEFILNNVPFLSASF